MSHPARCKIIHKIMIASAYRDNNNHLALVVNLISEPVTDIPEFDLVAVLHSGQASGSNVG